MIFDAWYMVSEYHLNLGPNDTLEKIVYLLKVIFNLPSTVDKTTLISKIANCKNNDFIKHKNTLILNVPFRLQAPFLGFKIKDWKVPKTKLIENINKKPNLIYSIESYKGLSTKLFINDKWFNYLYKNQEIINGWIKYNTIDYLQQRNPNVPGIPNKLSPETTRKLTKVIKFWKLLSNIEPIYDIYEHKLITQDNISIKEFPILNTIYPKYRQLLGCI